MGWEESNTRVGSGETHGEGEGTGNHLNERRGSRVEWAPGVKWALGGRAGKGVTVGQTLEPGKGSRCLDGLRGFQC